MYNKLKVVLFLFLANWMIPIAVSAQSVLMDKGVQIEGLWCFPVYGNEQQYRYLPTEAKLALDRDSLPQFSFLRYILANEKSSTIETVTQAGGGGILHFMVLYHTPEEQIAKAAIALQELMENEEIKLVGPIIFDQGRYNLISSILQDDGNKRFDLIGSGEAPIFENSRIALSFSLDPIRSKLLLESFKMNTPDVSLMFELGFSGYSDLYEAEMTVDWEEIQKSESFGGGVSVYYISADIEKGMEELRKNGAITLVTNGENEQMESLVQTAYQRLTDLLFDPVEIVNTPPESQGGLMDAISGLIGGGGGLDSRKTTGFGLGVTYKRKDIQRSGGATLTFSGRSKVQRNHIVTFNIGNLFKEYGDNEQVFRDVPMDDPAFRQRTIHVGIDGNLEKEFGKMVSHVTLQVQKVHADSQTVTLKELSISGNLTRDSLGNIRLSYLNFKDSIQLDWLKYNYRTIWQFNGGGMYETEWQTQSASMINLYTPFRRKNIFLEADLDILKNQEVRNIYININYPFFNKDKEEWGLIRKLEQINDHSFQITLPNGQGAIDYNITWFFKDGRTVSKDGQDVFGLLFLDQLPEATNE